MGNKPSPHGRLPLASLTLSLREPVYLITDKLRSYSAAHRSAMPSVCTVPPQYENNRAEVSHPLQRGTASGRCAVGNIVKKLSRNGTVSQECPSRRSLERGLQDCDDAAVAIDEELVAVVYAIEHTRDVDHRGNPELACHDRAVRQIAARFHDERARA